MLEAFIALTFSSVVNGAIVYFFQKKLTEVKKKQDNHHNFLLNVKHDIPILHKRVSDLEEQILPPVVENKDMD